MGPCNSYDRALYLERSYALYRRYQRIGGGDAADGMTDAEIRAVFVQLVAYHEANGRDVMQSLQNALRELE